MWSSLEKGKEEATGKAFAKMTNVATLAVLGNITVTLHVHTLNS